ncbi:MAG TPA: type II secretion system protein [Tepidisphaeraceae bacterium]|jgi:prepilin-type N-terminal cleavage/methylation domain-containing protein|nr:type II secretion system protein [Tepidisphaeraceae bacterium]
MTHNRRRGFTLIELMVVLGIMLLLITLAVLGYQHLDKVASENTTRTRLELLASLQAEFELVSPTNMIEGPTPSPAPPPVTNAVLTLPNPIYITGAVLGSPGSVAVGSQNRYSTPYLGYSATPPPPLLQNRQVLYTSAIIQIYAQVAAVQTAIGQLPTAALMPQDPDAGIYTDQKTGNTFPSLAPQTSTLNGGINTLIVVDGWKNPIIYVPSAGLAGVWIGGTEPPNGVVPATAVVSGVPWAQRMLVRSIDHRPFWASAGADGNFDHGDDNMYSAPVIYTPY